MSTQNELAEKLQNELAEKLQNEKAWLVYRRSDGWVGKCHRVDWEIRGYDTHTREILVEGLTWEQARNMCRLANEGESQ